MEYRDRRASNTGAWLSLCCLMLASCTTEQAQPVRASAPTYRPATLDESWAQLHPPTVPTEAILANHHGNAVVMAQVGTDGKVLATRLDRSTGYLELDESAESAVRNWKFEPCYKGDRPDVCWARAPVHFSPPNNAAARAAKLTIRQPGVAASPAQQPYSIPWPRDEQGRPLAGTTLVLARVDTHGEVVEVRVETSSGQKSLDDAALEGVRRWHFKPAYRDGVPTDAYVRVPVVMDFNGPALPYEPTVAPFPDEGAARARETAELLGPPPGVTSTMVSRRVTKDDHDPEADYINAVGHAIEAHWPKPPSVVRAWCTVHITQIPGGEVVGVEVASGCPYDAKRRKALEDAIWQASPLPYKGYESVWCRQIEFSFGA